MHSIEGERYYAKYAVFSNLSFETLDNKHEYQIVLSGLCPGVPINTLFNQKRTYLFFDRPFQNKNLCNEVDNTNVVMRDMDYNNRVWDDTKVDYTLRKIIEEFPQYSIRIIAQLVAKRFKNPNIVITLRIPIFSSIKVVIKNFIILLKIHSYQVF